MFTRTNLKTARPNGWYVSLDRLVDVSDPANVYYEVGTGDGDPEEFEDRVEAFASYEETRQRLTSTPNWELQAEYDVQWGEAFYPSREY